jgi:KDO2-lipid IV(A) lauroyltransferase
VYLKASFISNVLLRIFPYRKKVIDKNLKNCFPQLSHNERIKIRRQFYHFFATLMFEGIKQLSIKPDELRKRIKYSGYEAIDELLDQGRSAMLISFHYSNWEWGFVGYSAASKNPLDGIYQPMSNVDFGNMIVESRSRFGARMIPMEESYEHLQNEKTPYVLGLIPDQTPTPEKGFWMEFLGLATPVYRGPENIAKKFDLAVFYVDIDPIKQGYYKADVKLITLDPRSTENGWITEQYMKHLEAKIKAKPAYYLWSHKRWKHTIPSELPADQISKNYPPPVAVKIDY